MKTDTNTQSPITEFRLRWRLDPALSDARDYNAPHMYVRFPATRADLALALDTRDHHRIEARGQWGAATCILCAVMGEGEVLVDDEGTGISEDRARELLTCDGAITSGQVHDLRGRVWDGNNHVDFVPTRALRWLTGEDRWERRGYALVCWNEDGGIEEIRVDDGWAIADEYWSELGNEPWTYGDMDVPSREDALYEAGIDYAAVWLSDGDVMILVPADQVDAARAVFEPADAETEIEA